MTAHGGRDRVRGKAQNMTNNQQIKIQSKNRLSFFFFLLSSSFCFTIFTGRVPWNLSIVLTCFAYRTFIRAFVRYCCTGCKRIEIDEMKIKNLRLQNPVCMILQRYLCSISEPENTT